MSPEERKLQLESFDHVWQTIRDKHWEKNPGGADWDKVRAELRPKALNALCSPLMAEVAVVLDAFEVRVLAGVAVGAAGVGAAAATLIQALDTQCPSVSWA